MPHEVDEPAAVGATHLSRERLPLLGRRQHLYDQPAFAKRGLVRVLDFRLVVRQADARHEPRRYCRGALHCLSRVAGRHGMERPAYLPSLHLLVVGAVDWCTSLRLVRPDSSIAIKPGTPWTGAIGQGFGVLDTTTK